MEGFDYPVEFTERVEEVDEPFVNGQRLGPRAIQSIQGVGDNSTRTQPKVGDKSFQIDPELNGLNVGQKEIGNDGYSNQSNQVPHTNQLPNPAPTTYLDQRGVNAIRGN